MSKRVRGFARQADANHAEIVAAFKQLGVSVVDLRLTGKGCPDLLCGYMWRDRLVEVKPVGKKLRASQEAFLDHWKGTRPVVVRTVEDVQKLIRFWLS